MVENAPYKRFIQIRRVHFIDLTIGESSWRKYLDFKAGTGPGPKTSSKARSFVFERLRCMHNLLQQTRLHSKLYLLQPSDLKKIMCNSPSVQQAVNDSAEASKALNDAIQAALTSLNNSEQTVLDYINAHTNGIILAADTNAPETVVVDAKNYTKFSEDYSLDALDKSIDTIIDASKNSIKLALSDGADVPDVMNLVGSVGDMIKSGLSLAATSSNTTTKLSYIFSQFSSDSKDFAVCTSFNSGTVNASNAWGNKQITVISDVTVVARIKADPNLTAQEILQNDLDTLVILSKQLNKQRIEAATKNLDNDASLDKIEKLIDNTNNDIKNARKAITPSLVI